MNVLEQLKKMNEDRKKLVARLATLPEGFEKEELKVTIREHDLQVMKILEKKGMMRCQDQINTA